MSLDSYVTLGRSGLRVSPLTLGTMTFGEDHGWGSSPEESANILAAYLDRGGNSIDTANIYTNGHSEKIIGDYFASRSALRDRVVIGTKFFGNLYENDPNGGGPGRKAIVQQLENSLRRLQTDYVDIYWLHNFDPVTPVEETLRALDDLIRDGKVRYVGFSDVAGVGCCRSGNHRAFPRVGSDHRAAVGVLAARTHLGGRVDPHGSGPGHGRDAMGPAEERVPVRQVLQRHHRPGRHHAHPAGRCPE